MEPLMTHLLGQDLFGKPLHAFPDHAVFGFVTPGCYKATVNESETITDAKAVRGGVFGFALTAVERS
jgi:hypothetical protein